MKKIIVFAILLIFTTITFSQQTKPSSTLTQQDYLKKSKHQNTAASIFLYGGAASWVTCFFIIPKIKWGPAGAEGIFYGLFGVGLLAMPASIPFFIAAGRNKKKGMSLSIRNETAPQLQNSNFTYRAVPSVTMKIKL